MKSDAWVASGWDGSRGKNLCCSIVVQHILIVIMIVAACLDVFKSNVIIALCILITSKVLMWCLCSSSFNLMTAWCTLVHLHGVGASSSGWCAHICQATASAKIAPFICFWMLSSTGNLAIIGCRFKACIKLTLIWNCPELFSHYNDYNSRNLVSWSMGVISPHFLVPVNMEPSMRMTLWIWPEAPVREF